MRSIHSFSSNHSNKATVGDHHLLIGLYRVMPSSFTLIPRYVTLAFIPSDSQQWQVMSSWQNHSYCIRRAQITINNEKHFPKLSYIAMDTCQKHSYRFRSCMSKTMAPVFKEKSEDSVYTNLRRFPYMTRAFIQHRYTASHSAIILDTSPYQTYGCIALDFPKRSQRKYIRN